MKKLFLKPVAIIMAFIILLTTLFSVGIISFATSTELTAFNLKVNGGSDRTNFGMSLPIATGDYVEFSFDMRSENGQIPKFIVRDNYANKAIEPVKVERYRYTFNFQRTKTGDTNKVVRWFLDFTNIQSDVVISNMELYKTDSNYANKQGANLLAGVFGRDGDFDGWSYEDNKVTSWTDFDAVGGKVLCRSADDLNSNRYAGTAVVTKPFDYFTYVRTDMDALNLKVNGGLDRTHFGMSLPIATGDYVEFSFDMRTENGQIPKFIYRDNYANKAIEPVKVEGYRYTFNFQRTKTGDTNKVVRWFLDFTNIQSDVVISNMELYKTDSNYENKQGANLLAGVFGVDGNFDGWSYEDNKVTSWTNFDAAGGKVLCRSGDDLNSNRYAGTSVVTKPLNYFTYTNDTKTELTALNIKANATGKDVQAVIALPIATSGEYAEFSFDMKVEGGTIPTFMYRDNYANKAIEPVKVEGYRYTFHINRTKVGDTGSIVRWFFNFTNMTSDVVISNMELHKTDSNYENKQGTNLMSGVYGKNGDFDGWSLTDNHAATWNDLTAGKILYRGGSNPQPVDYAPLTGTTVVKALHSYFDVCEAPKMAQIKLNKSSDNNPVYLLLNCKDNLYYELSFDLNYEENKGLYLVCFQNYEETMVDIAPIRIEDYKYTFRFKANYNNREEDKGIPFAIVFDSSRAASGVTANAYISNISLSEYTDDTYSNKSIFGNYASGENGYGKTGKFDDWNGKIVLEYDKEISTTTSVKGDVWLKSDFANVSQDIFDCEIVNFDASKFPPLKKMLHIVSSAKGNGRDIQLYLDCQKDKYYEFSFKMKLEDGEIPKFAYKNEKAADIAIVPVKIEGNKYTFNFKAIDSNIEKVGQRFKLDFDQLLSEVNISCFELYETDLNFKNSDRSINYALGDNGYGIDGCFSDWKAYLGKDAIGGSTLMDNYSTSANKSYFYMELLQMKEGFIDKSTKAGEHMIKLTSYSEDPSESIFFLDCEKDSYYELSFFARKETGNIPTFVLRDSEGKDITIKPYNVDGCKYTFRFKAQSNVQKFVMRFEQKLDAATISYLVLNKSNDSNYSNIDKSNNLAAGANGYGLKGDFDDWNENYTEASTGLGKIQLAGKGSDKLRVSFTKIPKNYFNYEVYSEPQMLHFKREEDLNAERFGLRFNLPNDPDATNYVFSYRLKLKEGIISYIQAPDPSGKLSSITPAYNYGDTYYFHLRNNAGDNESFAFNFYFKNIGVDGYITDLQLYAADGDYNITSEINLASIYGKFMDWSDRGSSKLGGITEYDDSVEIVGLEKWTDGYFEFPDYIPFLNEEENWWLKYDLTDVIDTGVVKGQLKDKTGKAINNTNIKLSNLFEDIDFETLTNKNGKFEFSDVPVGQYSLSVTYSDGNMYTFDENIYITNKGDIVSLSLVLNEDITIEYVDADVEADVDTDVDADEDEDDSTTGNETESSSKKVYKKKYYKKRINSGGLPIIAWVGIGLAVLVLIGGVTVILILKVKKKKTIIKTDMHK